MQVDFPKHVGLIRLSSQKEIIIYLIREELKSRWLTNGLIKVGFDGSDSLDLGPVILILAGFEERTDELYNWYFNLLDKYAGGEKKDQKQWDEKAFDLYLELTLKKKNLI